MNRKLKAFGALLSSALMLGALAVVSAPAETGGHFVSAQAHTLLSGEQHNGVNKFTDAIGTVSCEEAKFSGTTNAATFESVTVSATYGKCTNGTNTVTVHMNGCGYTFTVNKTPATKHNTVHLVCPAGQSVTLTVFLEHSATLACTIHIKPQTPAGGLTYTNVGSPHYVTAKITSSGITVTRTPGFFGGCLFAPENGTNSTLEGEATLKGFDTETKPIAITAT